MIRNLTLNDFPLYHQLYDKGARKKVTNYISSIPRVFYIKCQ